MGTTEQPILLILDIDETLIYADEKPLDRPPDFRVGSYHLYRRPHLTEFLTKCDSLFQIAVWSSSGTGYLAAIVENIFPCDISFSFVWSRDRCVQKYHPERLESYFVKDLKKVKRLGFDLRRVLIVDDTPEKVERNFGNAIYVTPFYGDQADTELAQLGQFLALLSTTSDVRSIEKRGWRSLVQPSQ